jgi:hypothetical protein
VIELWHQALGNPVEKKPERADSIEIGKIMNTFSEWERAEKPVRQKPYGLQKVWRKRRPMLPFPGMAGMLPSR